MWKPIETAPKNGLMLLLSEDGHHDDFRGRITVGFWGGQSADHGEDEEPSWTSWHEDLTTGEFKQPTHWMPLPKPPR